MIRVRNPSLEFNWLPNSVRKAIPTPRLLLDETEHRWGAYYMRSTDDRCVNEYLDLDLKEGAAVVLCANQHASALAHEYRHHWQIESGFQLGSSVWSIGDQSYESSILKFFKTYWWEMDALRFELTHAPYDVNLLWQQLILESH